MITKMFEIIQNTHTPNFASFGPLIVLHHLAHFCPFVVASALVVLVFLVVAFLLLMLMYYSGKSFQKKTSD